MTSLILILLLVIGCSHTEQEDVYKCTDIDACNFNENVNIYVPESCYYEIDECGGSGILDLVQLVNIILI